MTSYFDDLNIRTDPPRNNRRQQHNVDLDDFMCSPRANTSVDPAVNLSQLMQTANLLRHYRDVNQAAGNQEQEAFLDNLVTQLLEESQNDIKGPPPASTRFIRLLPNIKPSQLNSEETCIICKDNLKTSGNDVTKMPCGHYFDRGCLVPWLELHNTCPLCRHKVETEQEVREEEEEEARSMMYG
ncbi:hypothetical protein BX666DRAFT_1911088 [Dichotomocladium elegans]|nr:hypothetical protein BX666DRAFT_1911088 [Dichotomocladium elegans]